MNMRPFGKVDKNWVVMSGSTSGRFSLGFQFWSQGNQALGKKEAVIFNSSRGVSVGVSWSFSL